MTDVDASFPTVPWHMPDPMSMHMSMHMSIHKSIHRYPDYAYPGGPLCMSL